MEPLKIENLKVIARLPQHISLPTGTLALDGLLAAAIAVHDEMPAITVQLEEGTFERIDIPLEKEPLGRFHLASFAHVKFSKHELRHIHRRYPLAEALAFSKETSYNPTNGHSRSFRDRISASFVKGNQLEWGCRGDAEQIRELLDLIDFIGAHRKVAYGRVSEWIVEPCEHWDGFPVMLDGRALRPLPLDWPGLAEPKTAWIPITYPYWQTEASEICAIG
jgi:hypothetical protein